MTTGEPLRVRAAMKPISSLNRALSTVDVATGEPATAINQRSDVCAVPAAGGGRRGDGRAGAGRGGDWRSSAATRSPRSAATSPATWKPGDPMTAPNGPVRLRARRAAGRGQVARSARLLADALGVPLPRHRRTTSRRRPGKPIPDIFVDDGEAALPGAGAGRRARPRSPTHDGVLALGGGAVLDAGDPGRAAPGTRWCYLRSSCPTRSQRVGLGAGRPLLAVNPRATLQAPAGAAPPALRGGRAGTVDDRRPHARRRSPPTVLDCWTRGDA